MMVVDTSALIAIVTDEPEREAFESALAVDGDALVSTATAVEFLIVAFGRGHTVYRNALRVLDLPVITLISLDEEQMYAAVRAHQTYGRGRHPAGLNFGDTFAYALAATRGLPLLYKGADFSRTDVTPAAPTTT
jgi:ribonuclease VapC